jgi:valyl-tRNA synthetase
MIWNYVAKNKSTMENQLKTLGASCDWSRNKFTLDPEIIKIVYRTFNKLYDDGLIYRGERIVNFCPKCGTAYSQLEVNSKEQDDNLYYLDYGSLTIATTRPETIFADVAVAVNPKDKRYQKLIGKMAKLPLVNRDLPIISDNLVDISFGTGALKITPGHDSVDFEIGQKHGLPTITVIDEKGRMINTPEKYLGMKAETAREEVIKDLQKAKLIKKVEKLHHVVGLCYRHATPIEPLLSQQWFIKVAPLTKPAIAAIKKNKVKFAAKKFEKIALHWLKNLRDWNISRQIVWGIRIPAWKCVNCHNWEITDGVIPNKCSKCGSEKLVQDNDTFDTWFSSGQWPLASLEASPFARDFKTFYPTSVMETAYDILPFWVIRMIMLGLYATKEVPFKEVVIHGLVRDREGKKISKSKGNVIDPMDMIEKYGADALRMSLVWGALIENDICLSEDNVRAMRNFTNKVWNAARFVKEFDKENKKNTEFQTRIKTIAKEATEHLEKYRLNLVIEFLYSEFWHWFCDEAIEQAKLGKIGDGELKWGLETFLKLLHPFMPFVTETIWGELKSLRKYPEQLLITSSWPKN